MVRLAVDVRPGIDRSPCPYPRSARPPEWPVGRPAAKSPSRAIPRAIIAPELPALTTASTSPRFINSKPTFIEESFIRSAALGDSRIGTICEAAAMENLRRVLLLRPARARSPLCRPPELFRHCDFGPRAPPLRQPLCGASITTHRVDGDFRHMSWDCLTLLDLEHGAATIKAAVSTGAVR